MADSTLLDLTLRIGAQVADLQAGLANAGKQVDGFSSKVASIGKFIAGAFTVTAISAAATAVFNFAQEIGDATNAVKGLTGAVGSQLVSATSKVLAISKTFDKDFNTVLTDANTISKQFGVSLDTALEDIQAGLAIAGNQGDEFLDIVKEYPSALNDSGIAADEFVAIASQTLTQGLYSDKGIDAIKEASLRIREMTPATKDALAAIGISSKQLQSDIANGTLSTFGAIQKVSAKLNEFKGDSAVVGTALADIFGGPGEDVGIGFIKSLATIDTNLDSLVSKLDDGTQAQLRLSKATAQWDEIFVTLFGNSSTLFTNIKAAALDFAVKGLKLIIDYTIDISNYFIQLYNDSAAFRTIVQAIVTSFKQAWTNLKLLGQLLFNIFGTAGKLISAVLKGELASIPDIYKDALAKMKNVSSNFAKETGENINEGINNIFNNKPITLISKPTLDKANKDLEAGLKVPDVIGLKSKSEVAAAPTFHTLNAPQSALDFNKQLSSQKGPKQKTAGENFIEQSGGGVGDIGTQTEQGVNVANQAIDSYLAKLGELRTTYVATTEDGSAWAEGMEAAAGIAQSQFGALATSGIQSFQDLAKGVASAVKNIIAALLAKALAAAISSAFISGGNPIIGAIIAAAGSAAVIGLFNAIPGFEKGGVTSGGLAITSEGGPELLNLPKGTRVTPHNESMRMLSSYGSGGNNMELSTAITADMIAIVLKERDRRRN